MKLEIVFSDLIVFQFQNSFHNVFLIIILLGYRIWTIWIHLASFQKQATPFSLPM